MMTCVPLQLFLGQKNRRTPPGHRLKQLKYRSLTYFHTSRPSPCPYIPGNTEQMLFTDLSATNNPQKTHNLLSQAGYRRSQNIVYKPNCVECNKCIAVRVKVNHFHRKGSLKRVWHRNHTIKATILPPKAEKEYYDLFRKYVASRHSEGGMEDMNLDHFTSMIEDSPIESRIVEFRTSCEKLIGACLTDILDDGISLVYSFFEPTVTQNSIGTHMILWHIEHARTINLPFVYLGYWIAENTKMAYKYRFQPIQMYDTQLGWHDINHTEIKTIV